jgi:hypothetical protein
MAEQPPLNRSYVISYAANDRDFPTIGLRADPRVAGYRVPEDLSPHPDSKRYPNHVFTGSQPSNGDERVTHVYEILPAPWVPFTRYDDDLGPIQGRRRDVKNEGQVASLAADKRVTYEAREGSAIVYTEIEESWSIAVDEDGNSLFPVKDRDFYDASRGPVQERRQLFVPTGEEEGSLENVNGVITQTSYEPYNEFLSFKVVQTYKVNGPQLIGRTTNNEGQLVTITAQRKAAENYIPPNPTATRTVEASREDAESLVETIIDTPSVFKGETKSIEKPDNVPAKFRATIPTLTTEESLAGTVGTPMLSINDLSKSEQQVTEFVKRIRTTSRSSSVVPEAPYINVNAGSLASNSRQITGAEFVTELGGGYANVIETYPFIKFTDYKTIKPAFGTISDQIEDLGDGTAVRRQVILPKNDYIFDPVVGNNVPFWTDGGNTYSGESLPVMRGQDYDEELDIVIPYVQVVAEPDNQELAQGKRRRVTPRDIVHSVVQKYNIEDVQDSLDEYYWEIPDMISISLPNKLKSVRLLVSSSGGSSTGSGYGDTYSFSRSTRGSVGGTIAYDIEEGFQGNIPTIRAIFFLPKDSSSPDDVLNRLRTQRNDPSIKFWPNARPESYQIAIVEQSAYQEFSESVSFDSGSNSEASGGSVSTNIATIPPTIHEEIIISIPSIASGTGGISVDPQVLLETNIPIFPTGFFLYQINASPYKFSYTRVDALLVNITSEYV